MRTGNYMTQERMIRLSSAAYKILECYSGLQKEIRAFIANGAREVSLDTVHEIMSRHVVDFEAIQIIAEESAIFTSRRASNTKAREAMKRLREHRQEQAIDFEEEGSIAFSLPEGAIGAKVFDGNMNLIKEVGETKELSPEEKQLLRDIEYLRGLHEKLRREHGAAFVWQDQICKTLNIFVANIGPVIEALEKHNFIQKSGLQNRYLILDV